MDRHLADLVLHLRPPAEGVGHVAGRYRASDHVQQLRRRLCVIDTHHDPAESGSTVLSLSGDREPVDSQASLHRHVGDGQSETRGHRRQQHLGGLHPHVGAAVTSWFVHRQLELSGLHAAAISAIPARGYLHIEEIL